ncbi:hypothetical protein D3C75_1316680 [compost metagenome]
MVDRLQELDPIGDVEHGKFGLDPFLSQLAGNQACLVSIAIIDHHPGARSTQTPGQFQANALA